MTGQVLGSVGTQQGQQEGQQELDGLYDPAFEHDSCGIGFTADIKGRASHQIIADALTILINMEHQR